MLNQINMSGLNKVEVAIKRLQMFEPDDGYYLCFSGGKDSSVIKALADMAGVKYDAHYSLTSVDHPELVRFIKDKHPDVLFEVPRYKDGTRITMWNLIPRKKMPPTRVVRYCCDSLKEHGGEGRFCITGVRHAESAKRATRGGLEAANGSSRKRIQLDPDNPDNEEMVRICPTKGKHIINPIIDWEEDDVWEFIKAYNVPYCTLYDKGYKRLGCIGYPMSTNKKNELEAYPKYKQAYIRAFDRMLKNRKEVADWETGQDVYNWWISK